MRNPASVGQDVARVSVRKPRMVKPPRPVKTRIYTRKPPAPRLSQSLFGTPPVTTTPTLTGTGVTTTTGGFLPGAPPSPDTTGGFSTPRLNLRKANPLQLAQALLQPQYAALDAQQHQAQLMSGQQIAAIRSYGLDLAKILGTPGPTGAKGTLPPEYAAALEMANERQFAYQQFLVAQKYADQRAQIAAQLPTLYNQIAAQRADQNLKMQAFNLQRQVAQQTYGLNVAKTNAYNAATNARLTQSQQRINLSQKQYRLAVAKANRSAQQWNATQYDKQTKVDLSLSRASGRWVNSQGVPVKDVPFKNPPPPYYKPSSGGRGGSSKPPALRGLTQTQYRNAYGDALGNAKAARQNGVSRTTYLEQAVINRIPRWVAARAWKQSRPRVGKPGYGKTKIGG